MVNQAQYRPEIYTKVELSNPISIGKDKFIKYIEIPKLAELPAYDIKDLDLNQLSAKPIAFMLEYMFNFGRCAETQVKLAKDDVKQIPLKDLMKFSIDVNGDTDDEKKSVL